MHSRVAWTLKTNDLLKDLVRINSINLSLVLGAPREAEIAEHIEEFMRDIVMDTWVEEVESLRSNAVGALKGTGYSLKLSRILMITGEVRKPEEIRVQVR